MFLLRTARQSTFVRLIASATPATTSRNAGASVGGRRLYSDYGSGAVKKDTPNDAVHHEHPGPPPPNTGNKGKEQQQPSSGESSTGGSSKRKSNAQPKILNESPPKRGEESEDVAKHNREMDQRADKAHERVKDEDVEKDKVHKGYWSGTGGVDKDP